MVNKETVFSVFDEISPKRKEPTIQALYDYEKHYLDLLRKYRAEIEFVDDLLKQFRREQIVFFQETLPDVSMKLDNEHIDADVKKAWLKRLESNIDRSFALSETLIADYTTKNIDEFKKAVNEKLRSL